jgi:hypothetical protein
MRDPAFGEKLPERMWQMEGLLAEAKQNHGSSASTRGIARILTALSPTRSVRQSIISGPGSAVLSRATIWATVVCPPQMAGASWDPEPPPRRCKRGDFDDPAIQSLGCERRLSAQASSQNPSEESQIRN